MSREQLPLPLEIQQDITDRLDVADASNANTRGRFSLTPKKQVAVDRYREHLCYERVWKAVFKDWSPDTWKEIRQETLTYMNMYNVLLLGHD